MAVFRHTIRPTETERFSTASGPVKIIMRDGKILDEPEIIECRPEEPTVYGAHNRKVGNAKT